MPQEDHLSADEYFLGGRDLEMVAIRELLDQAAPGRVHDKALAWGARASSYEDEIIAALQRGDPIVLVELIDDLGLVSGPNCDRVTVIDHHGSLAGENAPTALEQVFRRLKRPASEWTRWRQLVAANDRGHVRALEAAGATADEIRQVRAADRRAQGISDEEEATGRQAAREARVLCDGRLTVVHLPHARAATVTDVLEPSLGGPGYRNLLIVCPQETYFFGDGGVIRRLAESFADSYCGGELPVRGYWGVSRPLNVATFLQASGNLDSET